MKKPTPPLTLITPDSRDATKDFRIARSDASALYLAGYLAYSGDTNGYLLNKPLPADIKKYPR